MRRVLTSASSIVDFLNLQMSKEDSTSPRVEMASALSFVCLERPGKAKVQAINSMAAPTKKCIPGMGNGA